ncbi:MAG: LPP20 family lipoprotein [Bacteroidetes bacterium]|nr:LPP20 family lipoprotein [Bacteroidota bacterium]
MKRTICFRLAALIIITPILISSQQFSSRFIKDSPDYYWGEAKSSEVQEAEAKALAMLTGLIAKRVTSNFKSVVKEEGRKVEETVENILETYSTATLKNVERDVQPIDGEYRVFLYILKKEVEKIFDTRREVIGYIFNNAEQFDREKHYTYALKSYYFALLLINSLPDQMVKHRGYNLTTEIPKRINSIIADVKFKLTSDKLISDKERELIFDITLRDKSVQSLDFFFWDGTNQVSVSAADGQGVCRLYGASVKFPKLDLDIKTKYFECKDEIKEVSELWDLVVHPTFRSDKKIQLEVEKKITQVKEANNAQTVISEVEPAKNVTNISQGRFNLQLTNGGGCDQSIADKIQTEALVLLELINNKDIKQINDRYSNDPFIQKKIQEIMKYNDISVVDNSIQANLNKFYSGWEIRKVRVHNNYSSLNKQTTEYLILDFDNDGKLYDINFGILENLYEKFVRAGNDGNDWGNRQVIIKFMEKYRTSYLSRDLATIDSLFADEAVIIVGRVLEKNKKKDVSSFYNQIPNVEYLRLNKDEYLKRQKTIFQNNKDIYIGYSTFNIIQKNKQPGVYGLSLRQNYNSTGYADEGYLFLLIDFEEALPQIYVRSWQPQEWDEKELIKLSNFNLNK